MFKKAGLLAASCALVGGIHAAPSATGFFCGVNMGGTYTPFNEYFRGKGDDKDSQTKLFDESKAGFFIGAHVGYGYEFSKGFFAGFKVVAHYDTANIKKDAGSTTSDLHLEGKTASHFKTEYSLEAKPKFTYGAHLMLGGKVAPNILAYALIGFESTYTTIEQYIVGVRNGADTPAADSTTSNNSNSTDASKKENTSSNTEDKQVLCVFNGKTPAKIDDKEVKDLKAGDKANINILRLVPGVGVRYFLSSGLFIDAEVDVPVGFGQKVDEKHYNANPGGTLSGYKLESVHSTGATLRVKSPVGVRFGVSVGYKF